VKLVKRVQSAICSLGLLLVSAMLGQAADDIKQVRRFPVAISIDAGRAYVANRSGSISTIVVRDRQVVGNLQIGRRLSDVLAVRGTRFVLATDESANEVILLERRSSGLKVVTRHKVAASPQRLAVAADGKTFAVTSLWARQVSVITLTTKRSLPRLATQAVIDLSLAPRELWLTADGRRLVAADAFGGDLAVIDVKAKRVQAIRRIPGHNIRSLQLDHEGKRLVMSHQMINGQVPTQRERVFWGSVIGNLLREIELKELFADVSEEEEYDGAVEIAHWRLHPLGRPSNASGDPDALVVTRSGKTIVALAGVGEVAISREPLQPFVRRETGRGPAAIAVESSDNYAFVVNKFDDSVSVVDINGLKVEKTISLGPVAEPTLVQRGEMLFHDARLSLDGWFSCHSCHTDGHTNGELNDNLGDGSFGAPKQVMSLLGVADTAPWAWNGQRKDLKKQIAKSIRETMRGHEKMASAENVRAIKAYIETLAPPPSLTVARGRINQDLVHRGKQVFAKHDCQSCHGGKSYTSRETYDVGLRDELGGERFNPPSLRGVSQRRAWLHDGRARHLEDVFRKQRHPNGTNWDKQELRALVEFLKSL